MTCTIEKSDCNVLTQLANADQIQVTDSFELCMNCKDALL